eukprot:CAMPEP_0178992218 /NCGR_PEP_ID=MMETSP0795-20121207/5980_1 /TAXON_ID=88552 /ORGANISM="Amoebophrya sp., Strain Ameob2" /LENGTH=1071 /DNA_ID=CAMNT_0020684051 /DNA_START=188 /DNA_END=3403 /DNA_ORIENTATION=-
MAARTTAPRATAPFPATLATAPSLFRRGLLVLQKSGQFGTVVAEAKQEGGASNNAPTCLVSKLFSEDVENAVEEVPLADLAAIEISVLWGCNIASVEDAAKACASLASMNNQLHVDGVSPRFFLSYAFAETVDGETEKSVRELFQYLQEKSPAFRGGKLAKVVEYESCGSGKKKRSKKEKGGEGPHLPTVMQHYAGLMQYVPKSSASEMKNELQSTKAGRGISAFAPPSRTSKGADDGGAGGSTSPIADSPSTLASDAKTNSAASPQCPLHSWVFFHTDVISGPLKLRFFLDQICIAGLQKLKLGYNTMSISGDNLVVKITADEKTKSGKAKPPVAVKFDANGVAQGLRGGKLKMLTTTSAGKTGSGSVQKPSSQNNHNEQKPPAESFSLRGELCEVAAQAGVLQEFFDLNKTPASRLLESKFSDTALYYYLRDYNKQLEGLELSGTKEEEELIAEKYWMQLSTNTTGTSLGSPSCTPAGGEASPASSSGKNATWLTYFERSAAGSSNATTITDAAGGKSKSAGEDDAEARAEAKMLATDFDDEILGTSEAYNMGWQAMLPFLSPLDRKRLFATLRENLELLVCFFYGVKVPDRLGGTAAAASPSTTPSAAATVAKAKLSSADGSGSGDKCCSEGACGAAAQASSTGTSGFAPPPRRATSSASEETDEKRKDQALPALGPPAPATSSSDALDPLAFADFDFSLFDLAEKCRIGTSDFLPGEGVLKELSCLNEMIKHPMQTDDEDEEDADEDEDFSAGGGMKFSLRFPNKAGAGDEDAGADEGEEDGDAAADEGGETASTVTGRAAESSSSSTRCATEESQSEKSGSKDTEPPEASLFEGSDDEDHHQHDHHHKKRGKKADGEEDGEDDEEEDIGTIEVPSPTSGKMKSFPIRKLRALDATVAERDAVYEDAGVDPERAARAANKTKQKAQAAEKLLPAIDEGDAPAAPKPMAVSSGPESKSGEPATGQKQNKKDDEAKKPNTTTALQQLRKRQVIPKENRRGTKEDFEGGMRTAELEFQQYLRAVQPDLAMRIAKRFDIPLVEDAEKRVAKHFAKEIRPLAEKWMCEVPPK